MDRHTRLNYIYSAMKKRCYDPKCKAYKYYGERGITVCKEWLDPSKMVEAGTKAHNVTKGFIAFKEWAINNGYRENLTIDRIDVNGNYCPENCRWTTAKEQQNNTRKNLLIAYKGETKTLPQWCEELGINYFRTRNRLFIQHWSVEKAFEMKENATLKNITYKGKTQSIADWCRELNISPYAIRNRLRRGWSVEEAFGTEKREYKV